MKPSRALPAAAPGGPRSGATLLLSLLVLFVLLLIVFQISISTGTNARVARNEETLRAMDEAIESLLLQVYEDLGADSGAGGGGAGSEDPLGAAGGAGGGGGDLMGGGGSGGADSREDDWAKPQRTELNEVRLRILVQDEDSKLNLLSILAEDEDEAEEAFERLVRVIELSRRGTLAEIDSGTAQRMAEAMLEFMTRRRDAALPQPALLSDDPENEDIGLPLTLREFAGVDRDLFPPDLFRDFRDERGDVVHSLGSFLTVWTSASTSADVESAAAQTAAAPAPQDEDEEGDGDEDGDGDDGEGDEGDDEPQDGLEGEEGEGDQEGGGGLGGEESTGGARGTAVNVNTAPVAVLQALIDERDLPRGFWEEVVEFRNTEDETVEENDDPPLDEFGEEIVINQFFSSVGDLQELDAWFDVDPEIQEKLQELLTVESSIFSVFITARRPTGESDGGLQGDRESIEREETEGQGLVRTVRSVVWRRDGGDGQIEIVPLVRWEVIDYVPFEILDYPEDDRRRRRGR